MVWRPTDHLFELGQLNQCHKTVFSITNLVLSIFTFYYRFITLEKNNFRNPRKSKNMNLLQQKLYQESLKNRSESTLQQVIADTQFKNLVSDEDKSENVGINH